ncbi:cytokine-like nuclear factor N-PAC [Babylonia areolata]|uniref:cytokine-like nuclear factor N-PAC n=1 Tax=Babylonia areolata TaxID=304850 RepID=UPI003FD24AFE
MAAKFKVGDLVWAKMKGFSAWPGKVIEPKPEVKRPSKKSPHQFVFFYGSENYAWIPEEGISPYLKLRDKYQSSSRMSKGFKEALEAIESAWQALPATAKNIDLPSIDEEIAIVKGGYQDSPTASNSGESPALSKKEKKSQSAKKAPKPRTKPSGSGKIGRPKSEGSVRNHKDYDPYRLPDDDELDEPMEPFRKKKDKKPKTIPTPRKSLPVKRKAPLPTGSGDLSPSKSPKFFLSKAATSSADGDVSFSKFSMSYDGDMPKYKDEASEARLSPDDSRFPGDEEDTFALTDGDKANADLVRNKLQSRAVIPTPLRIGFLGLGIMGQGMVMNLLRSGHEVTVWNRTASKTREFSKAGAFRGNNPADVVQSCDITFTCVSDSVAVRDVVFGNQGVLQGITKGKCYVEMSTVDEETVQDVADAVMARGGTFLEAPVCGSRVPALEGQLTILTSGDRKLYDDCFSCFEAMGKKSFYLGNEVGTATRMKLIHNMVLGTVVASLAEGMALAEKVGLDQEDLTEVLMLGTLNCPTISHKSQAIMNQRFDPHFPLQHQQKDLRLVLSMGDSVEQPLYLAAAANELYKKARRLGVGEGDISAVYKATL